MTEDELKDIEKRATVPTVEYGRVSGVHLDVLLEDVPRLIKEVRDGRLSVAGGWIPISTLPPVNHPVLVYWDGVMVVTSRQTEVNEHWRGYPWLEPSHWMELPAPPLH